MNADILRAEAPIDDCWNRIGIRGDHSCEQLQRYIHCRNCPVHAQAAADLLDRIAVVPADPSALSLDNPVNGTTGARTATVSRPAEPDRTNDIATAGHDAFLLFRVADEWFALAARFISQVANASVIHSLPRVRSKDVLGLTNVRGQLTVCVSLSRLLDVAEASVPPASAAVGTASAKVTPGISGISGNAGVGSVVARFIVARDIDSSGGRERRGEEITVFPVDEVHGIERFSRAAHRVVPATLAHASAAHTRSLLAWKGRTVGVLDGTLLFETLRRSLG